MEIALILVIVAALVAFFVLRGKKAPPADQSVEPAHPRSVAGSGSARQLEADERPGARTAAPTTQAETPHARRKSEIPSPPDAREEPHSGGATKAEPAGPSAGAEDAPAQPAARGEGDARDLRDSGDAHEDDDFTSEADFDAAEDEQASVSREVGYVSVSPSSDGSETPPPLVRSPSPPDATRSLSLLSLRKGLMRSRESEGFFGRLKALLGGKKTLDPALAEEIEEVLLTSDVGVKTTDKILERLRDGMSRGDLSDEAKVFKALREEAHKTLAVEGTAGALVLSARPTVVLFVGVNGAGKTTTIGKLAQKLTAEGKKVMLGAGDTFRAAAVQQLQAWGQRTGCDVIAGKEGADPSSVLFDAISAAKAAGADVLLADTAGRLHTKTNLMQEMTKIQKVAGKALEGAPHETLLVIDSTNGQNALAQAREFKQALPLTGLVLTKLDGTAKGGVVLGICDDLKVPVRYVGVGERAEDLHAFEPAAFVEALLGAENEGIAA